MNGQDQDSSVRLDKWLWAARFFKTRSLAQDNIELGRVRLNGQRVKSSKEVKIGDMLEINRGQERMTVEVKGISAKRGGAPEAQKLYMETEESREIRERIQNYNKAFPVDHSIRGRPTKREGRKLREFMDELSYNDNGKFFHDQ